MLDLILLITQLVTIPSGGNSRQLVEVQLTTGGVCGNWVIEEGERCDDGNTLDNDGCSATCQIEPQG